MTDLGIYHDDDTSPTIEDGNPVPTGWRIDTEERAAWAVDRILAAEERLERVKAQAAHWQRLAERELERARAFFCPHLEEWAREHPPARGKTIHLATGDLAFRTVRGSLRVADPERALAWARANLPGAIDRKVTERVVAIEVRSYADKTGEIPPGCVVDNDREAFDIRGPRTKGHQ